MADVMTPEERSLNMAAIKGKDTKPEMIVRKYIFLSRSVLSCQQPEAAWVSGYCFEKI